MLLLALLLCAAPLSAQENPGTTAAPILQLPVGSRAFGMGSAFTAVSNDAAALYYNLAGLSRLSEQELSTSFMGGLAGDQYEDFSYAAPISFKGIFRGGYSSFGASALVSQDGTIDVNRTNPDGSFLSSQSLSAGEDLVVRLGYSERLMSGSLDIGDSSYKVNHFIGVGGEFVNSSLVQQYSARTFSGNFGYLADIPAAGVSLGVSASNVGGSLRYINQADPLPTLLRGGLAYQGRIGDSGRLTLSADADYIAQERLSAFNFGVEYTMMDLLSLRGGYQFMQDALGLTLGFGLRWQDRLFIDYAWGLTQNGFNALQEVSLSCRFGGEIHAAKTPDKSFRGSSQDLPPLKSLDQQRIETAPVPRKSVPPKNILPGWVIY